MQSVTVLPHQSEYMLAPYLFTEKRWVFFVCGYGSGKTKANVISLLYAVKKLQNKRDRSGDYARLIVAGYTLSHLNKTFLVYLRQMLNQSKTPYTENKKDNFMTLGTVTVFFVPMENPDDIFGMDVAGVFVEEADELTEDKAIEAVRSLSERCRQRVRGYRSPFLCVASTSQGQKGLYRIYTHFKKNGTAFVLIRGRTEDNLFLPEELISDMKRTYTPGEKRVFMDGEFLSIAKGRVLGDFDWERNYLDYDLDRDLKPDETVYIGMDFNCVAEGEKVFTLQGYKAIESVEAGKDFVLTRQGFKKVLNVFRNGENTVSRCAGVLTTRGHIFRTPEGDKAQWQVKKGGRTYFLQERESYRFSLFGTAVELLKTVNTLSTGAYCTTGIRTGKDVHVLSTLSVPERPKCRIKRFGSFLTGLCRRGLIYTIRMVLMTIGSNLLRCFLRRSIPHCAQNGGGACSGKSAWTLWKKQAEKSRNGTTAARGNCITGRYRSRRGQMVDTAVLLSAKFVEKILLRLLEPPCIVRSAKKSVRNPAGKRRAGAGKLTAETRKDRYNAHFAVSRLSELLRLDIAKSISIGGNEGTEEEHTANVYDLEVEDAHEYFVNGTLVHNTGFNRASAYVVREGVIYGIKYYDFPDPQDAPAVFRHDFPRQRILWLPDVTIKDLFPQYARELRKYGIQIIYRKKSPLVEDSCFLVNKLFYTGRLLLCRNVKDLAEACALAMRDKDNKIPKGKGPSSAMHAIDALRYVATFIASRDKAFRDIRRLVLDRFASFRSGEEDIKKLGGGYMKINPNVYSRKRTG
jgi:hypothetical protein